jgi:hypothetical protein
MGWRDVLAILLTVLFLGALVGGIVGGYLWLKRSASAAQERAFSGLEIFSEPGPGRVLVVFHTYYGFLVYISQTEYRFWANPEAARTALWRLQRFNMLWGLFAAGLLFIPLLSTGSYWAQLRSIRKQVEGWEAQP